MGAAGSTFIAPLMEKWVSSYQQSHPTVQINYRPVGSGEGIEEIKKGYLSFGATDAPLSDDQAKNMPPVVQIPASAGPVCIVYNLSNLKAPLKLSAKTLSGIFLGNIISWQDPEIAKDNPGVKLPRTAIIVVHRSDGSGTTSVFTSYLAKVSADWSSKSGQGLAVAWPAGLGAEGSKGILAIVKQTQGTIGYLELNYAKQNGLAVASIENRGGHFIEPNPASTAAAISAFADALAKDVRAPIVDPPASASDAYPISGLSFILIPKDRTDAEQQKAVKDFIAFIISTGQNSAEELSYAKLPGAVQQQGHELLTQLTSNGQQLK
jgi:phosphate transport system substrate-binding protein